MNKRRWTLLLSLLLYLSLPLLFGGCDSCKSLCKRSYSCLTEAQQKKLDKDATLTRCVNSCNEEKKQKTGRLSLIEEALNSNCK